MFFFYEFINSNYENAMSVDDDSSIIHIEMMPIGLICNENVKFKYYEYYCKNWL